MARNKKISQNTVNKILSVAIAVILWAIVIGGENPIKDRTIHSVPVQLKNLESLTNNNLAIAGDTYYTVDVKVKGQRTVVDPLTTKDIIVEADLFGYGKGQNYINLTASIPDNTELVEIRSPRIQVNIESLVGQSKPVNINFRNVPDGKEVGAVILQPTGVEISGAESLVNSVAWAFGSVDTKEYVEGEVNTIQVELQPLDRGEARVENVKMSSMYADVTYTVMDLKEVPLVVKTMGDPGLDKAIDTMDVPKSVIVRGLGETLKEVREVVVEPLDLSALELDENDQATVVLLPILPEGVELANANPEITAVLTLKDVSAKAIDFGGDDIQVLNVAEDMNGSIEPGRFTVIIKGSDELLDTLEKDDIQLFVDAAEVPYGDDLVELMIQTQYKKPFDQVSVAPETVQVQFYTMVRH